MLIAWILLILAIIFEVAGTMSIKLSMGFTFLVPTIAVFVFYAISFVTLAMSLKKLNVSVAYAIWAGLGTAIVSILGVVIFNEAMTMMMGLGILLVIVGVVVIKLAPTD